MSYSKHIVSGLALTHDIILLEIDDEHTNMLIENRPFYTSFEIAGGKYRGVEVTKIRGC